MGHEFPLPAPVLNDNILFENRNSDLDLGYTRVGRKMARNEITGELQLVWG